MVPVGSHYMTVRIRLSFSGAAISYISVGLAAGTQSQALRHMQGEAQMTDRVSRV